MEIDEKHDEKMEIDGGKNHSIEHVEKDFYNKITEAEKMIKTCKEADKISLQIQYLENVDTLFNILLRDVSYKKQKSLYDIWNYLYQVYAPLSMLSNEFTHYDLHANNVLIYKVAPNKYTKMIYYYPDGSKIEFNTIGIAKIIDYGRCFFHYNDEINSTKFIEILEQEIDHYNKEVSKNNMHWDSCGYNSFTKGFQKFDIDSRERNKSHDLRLVTNVNQIYKHYTKQICFDIAYKTQYGTPEISTFNYVKRGNKIRNVDEMHEELKQLYLLANIQNNSKQIETTHNLHGNIECWLDGSRPMVFSPGPVTIPDENRKLNVSQMNDIPISIPKSLQRLAVTPYPNDLLRKQTRSLGGKWKKRNEKKTRKTRK
jgi:hypothetical protein